MSLPDWSRAFGTPLFAAALRTTPADFQVTEELGYEFDGNGEHDYLYIEKTNTNTEWLSRQLAGFAEVPAKDIGYAGLKDRNAVTRQWFSVPRWHGPNWTELSIDGVELLEVGRHSKKLRRGAHRANHFRIVLRPVDDGAVLYPEALHTAVAARLEAISKQGVPNYYGEQRFGRDGANVGLADQWARGRRLPRHKRSLAISSARSLLFNDALQARVKEGTWNCLLAGDLANLDGTGSVFPVDQPDSELQERCKLLDLHPALELAGEGSDSGHEQWQQAFDKARVTPGSRSLRLPVRHFSAEPAEASLNLCFTLGRGAFATAVLREIAEY